MHPDPFEHRRIDAIFHFFFFFFFLHPHFRIEGNITELVDQKVRNSVLISLFFTPLFVRKSSLSQQLMLNYYYVVYDTIHLYFTYKIEQLTPPFVSKKTLWVFVLGGFLISNLQRQAQCKLILQPQCTSPPKEFMEQGQKLNFICSFLFFFFLNEKK